jgi:hypothetical protein
MKLGQASSDSDHDPEGKIGQRVRGAQQRVNMGGQIA